MKWAVLAALLALMALAVPYAEAILMKPALAKRLAAIKADKGRLATIDRELDFLRYLKQNQPPYLDTLFILAKAAPPGTRIETISMNRRGDLSLRGSMQNSTQVADFRSKVFDSGFFTNVVVEEQTPGQNKVIIRVGAQLKSALARESLAVAPAASQPDKPKDAAKEASSNASPAAAGASAALSNAPAAAGPSVPGEPGPALPAKGASEKAATAKRQRRARGGEPKRRGAAHSRRSARNVARQRFEPLVHGEPPRFAQLSMGTMNRERGRDALGGRRDAYPTTVHGARETAGHNSAALVPALPNHHQLFKSYSTPANQNLCAH
jgi:hypothetical protein